MRPEAAVRLLACAGAALAASALLGCGLLAGVEDGELAAGGASSTTSTGGASTGGGSTGPSMASTGGAGGAAVSSSSSTGSGGAPSAYVTAVMADMPSAYWRFGEGPGAKIASDATGNGNQGTYVDGVTLGAPGAIAGDSDTAATFDGISGFADFGDRFGFVGNATFSVELWIKPHTVGADWTGLVTKESETPIRNGWLLFIQSDLMTGFGVERWVSDVQTQAASAPPAIDVYAHGVATYDGSTLRYFVNGMLVKTGPSAGSLVAQTGHLVVGARLSGTGHWTAADIDEVAIYDHPLSQAAISAHYAAAGKP